jgi:agmatinase
MRPDRLERLRTQFGWPSVDTTPIGLSQPGCAEPLTLLGAPANPNVIGQGRDAACEIGLIGVPMDLGVTNRPGARFGPRALRAIERVGPFHHVHKIEPMQRRRVADLGDVPMRSRYDLNLCHADIEKTFSELVAARCRPLAVGGDHSITLPILKALGRDAPLALIHFDAHCDTEGPIDGRKFHHGGPFREAVLEGVLDPERTIQIGIRGAAEPCWEFSYASGMTVLHVEDVDTLGVAGVVARARAVVGDAPVYVSFDVDVLDPSVTPGTGTPEAGGLSARQAIAMLTGLAGLNVVGGDVVEVAPAYDPSISTALTAAQILFEILCLMALSPDQPTTTSA